MMKRFAWILCAAGLIASGTACTTIRELPRQQVEQQNDSDEQKYCRELIMCFLKGDADDFISRLTPEAQEKIDKNYFENTRKAITETMGQPVAFEYLTLLEYPIMKPYIWKVRFEKENRKGEKIRSEALFRIVAGRGKDNKILILGFQFL